MYNLCLILGLSDSVKIPTDGYYAMTIVTKPDVMKKYFTRGELARVCFVTCVFTYISARVREHQAAIILTKKTENYRHDNLTR